MLQQFSLPDFELREQVVCSFSYDISQFNIYLTESIQELLDEPPIVQKIKSNNK